MNSKTDVCRSKRCRSDKMVADLLIEPLTIIRMVELLKAHEHVLNQINHLIYYFLIFTRKFQTEMMKSNKV